MLLLHLLPGLPVALEQLLELAVDGVVLLLDGVQRGVQRVQLGVKGGIIWRRRSEFLENKAGLDKKVPIWLYWFPVP